MLAGVHSKGVFIMYYEDKEQFEKNNMFGTGTENTAYARFFNPVPSYSILKTSEIPTLVLSLKTKAYGAADKKFFAVRHYGRLPGRCFYSRFSSVTGGIKFSIALRSFGCLITKWIAGAFSFDTIAHCPSRIRI